MTLDDVHFFYYFALFETRADGTRHFCAYFSKEICRQSAENNNLSCLMVLPPYQSKGYGRFLIELSYAMTAMEGSLGTPERPFSDAGRRAYVSFWSENVVRALEKMNENKCPVTISAICEKTSMIPEDVICALQQYNLVRVAGKNQPFLVVPASLVEKVTERSLCQRPSVLSAPLQWTPNRN
jgi:GNAT superfamily N-acetyltransferase